MESNPNQYILATPVTKKRGINELIVLDDSSSDSEQDENQNGKTSVDGKKYSVYEDWILLKTMQHYKEINGSYGLSSPHLWNNIRYQRQVLEGARTAMSMRNRYTKLKEDVTDDNMEKIKAFVEKNGDAEAKNYYLKFRKGRIMISSLSMYESRKRYKKKDKTPMNSGKKSAFYQKLVERMTSAKKKDDIDTEECNGKIPESSNKKPSSGTKEDDDICNFNHRELKLKKVKVQLFKQKIENLH